MEGGGGGRQKEGREEEGEDEMLDGHGVYIVGIISESVCTVHPAFACKTKHCVNKSEQRRIKCSTLKPSKSRSKAASAPKRRFRKLKGTLLYLAKI